MPNNQHNSKLPKTSNPPSTVRSPSDDGGTPPKGRADNGRFEPGNNLSHGRKPGSLNQATLLARSVLAAHADELARKAVQAALDGSPLALKLCLERLVPPPRDKAVNFDLPTNTDSPADLAKAQHAILQAVATGEITPTEGHTVALILDSRRRTWESAELAERLTNLENRADELKQSAGKYPKVTWIDPWDDPNEKPDPWDKEKPEPKAEAPDSNERDPPDYEEPEPLTGEDLAEEADAPSDDDEAEDED